MIEILMIILIMITTINVVCLVEINNQIRRLLQMPGNNENKTAKRVHSSISQAKFDNVLQGRQSYKKYENRDGLYEPIKPKNGIEIKPRKEE